ncbi:MAG: hypothetical protein IJ619_08045 [Eubacterium sp.]|nr:hypothetical protein [Eubacterium sp.]
MLFIYYKDTFLGSLFSVGGIIVILLGIMYYRSSSDAKVSDLIIAIAVGAVLMIIGYLIHRLKMKITSKKQAKEKENKREG